MLRIAGLASNRGRNLMHIADRAPGGAGLSLVLTNREGAPVVGSAAERGIPTEVVPREEDEPRRAHERRVLERLSEYDVDLLCLDGYMRILTGDFLDSVPTTLNVHPSLLPAFPGTDAHEQVLDAGVRVTGCTVHVATEDVDAGPIVTQEAVPVYEDDDAASLKRRVLYDAEFVAYPRAVRWFAADRVAVDRERGTVGVEGDDGGDFPERRLRSADRETHLRYGENPHQEAALYADPTCPEATVVGAPQRNEGAKALSYNNYNDADAALELIKEFDTPAAAVIKHTNPAGCATASDLAEAYDRALATDPMSAFGGIVALNRRCDAATAEQVADSFKEVVVAPGYTDAALDVLTDSSNLRVLDVGDVESRGPPREAGGAASDADASDGAGGQDDGRRRDDAGDGPGSGELEALAEKPVVGGRLVQERDSWAPTREDLEVVTERDPTDAHVETMLFAWRVLKHVRSNAILFADGTETVGVGMGQVSRVDAVRLAAMKAAEHAEGKSADGAVMASDAFFPFPDGIEAAAEAGIEAVVQPGGSVNDEDVIDAADDLGIAMAFTGHRCFRHD